MEDTKTAQQFSSLVNTAARYRAAWHSNFGAHDGRFRGATLAHGEPRAGLYEMVYWVGEESRNASEAARLLKDLGASFEVRLDYFTREYVVLTDHEALAGDDD